ncbi:GNAT family N-acetyltransferase [Moritella sp. 24]|uniref:GNAT family N-acetyltransferase n=1 Tax=Moritella sp. 24 TaxID=2746230 RepID=UPI001BA47E87|nr:GNAT family N-acetyltransferase [Moritella sp. 24]QUM76678.1 GNAT family N-acetyltransferase [Moritella sp. 24]
MEFSTREASIKDVQLIASIHIASWDSAFEGLMPKGYIDSYTLARRKAEWSEIIGKHLENVIVAEVGNQVVGFLSYNNDRSRLKAIELSKLYLCPSVYDQGFGSLLLKLLEQEAIREGVEYISLYVLDCNQSAIKFYRGHGFKESGACLKTDYEGSVIIDIQMIKRVHSISKEQNEIDN